MYRLKALLVGFRLEGPCHHCQPEGPCSDLRLLGTTECRTVPRTLLTRLYGAPPRAVLGIQVHDKTLILMSLYFAVRSPETSRSPLGSLDVRMSGSFLTSCRALFLDSLRSESEKLQKTDI